jgi:hypothetical protein
MARPEGIGQRRFSNRNEKPFPILWILLVTFALVSSAQDVCEDMKRAMRDAILTRKLSEARYLALKAVVQAGCDAHSLAQVYRELSDEMLSVSFSSPQYSTIDLDSQRRVKVPVDKNGCWNSLDSDQWDTCCSQLSNPFNKHTADCVHDDGKRMCCNLSVETSCYLRLPALREVALMVRAQTDDDNVSVAYELQQDGFLRMYDTAGVLWPTAYFLGLCVAAPNFCGVPEVYTAIKHGTSPNALELGAGIGFPSIALARLVKSNIGGVVVATDNAPHALALTASNAKAANVSVATSILDFYEWADVRRIRQEYTGGFSVILGSALQSMFEDSTRDANHRLWKIMDALLDHSDHAIALLAHTTGLLNVPQKGIFSRIKTISGMKFGLKCRYKDASDFEISVLQRNNHLNQQQTDLKEEL